MQILLNNAEVTTAITQYVAAMVAIDLDRTAIEVEISSTRNPTSYNASVNLTPITDNKTAVATTTGIAVDASNWNKKAAEVVVTEEVKTEVVEEVKVTTQPAVEAEVTEEVVETAPAPEVAETKPSIFNGLKKPTN